MSALDAAAPKLLIRSIFGARVLQLARTPRPLEVEDFDESAPFVNADETPDLELFWPAGSDDVPGADGSSMLFTVRVEGKDAFSACARRTETGWGLRLPPDAKPFADVVGFARISILATTSFTDRTEWHADPILVNLPAGPTADNLTAMGALVVDSGDDLFDTDSLLLHEESLENDGENGLSKPLRIFRETVALYERQYAFFRENARYRLTSATAKRGIEALKHLTPEGARWIASHPDELQPVRPGQGIRINRRHWMPRHALVQTAVPDRETLENSAVVGFPTFLALQAAKLAGRLEAKLRGGADGESAVLPALAQASPQLWRAIQTLRGCEKDLKRMGDLYRRAVGITPPPFMRMPPATPIFQEIAQYQLAYARMQEWFTVKTVNVDRLVGYFTGAHSSRLYEYFTLVRILLDLKNAGFELTERRRFVYQNAGAAYAENADASTFNTFVMKRGTERLRLWYQPVISGVPGGNENEIGLLRTTTWSMTSNMEEPGMRLEESPHPYYTPDFVAAYDVEGGGGGSAAWTIIDSKFSKLSTAVRFYGLEQAFKYLLSIGTARPGDVFSGLTLFCGSVAKDDQPEGSLFNIPHQGWRPMPDMQFLRLNGFNGAEKNAGGWMLEKLRATLTQSRL